MFKNHNKNHNNIELAGQTILHFKERSSMPWMPLSYESDLSLLSVTNSHFHNIWRKISKQIMIQGNKS